MLDSMNKTVDILIPTYKPGREILKLIVRLQAQTVPVQKIIIMNTERSYWEKLVEECPGLTQWDKLEVHHVTKREFDHGATRNAGMKYSTADICVCMTQDALPKDEHMLSHLVAPLADEKIAVCYARQIPSMQSGTIERFTRSFNYPKQPKRKTLKDIETMGIKAFFCSDVCAAYNRRIHEQLGGFITQTIFNEDMIYASNALKAGYDVYYAAEAKVIHSHDYTIMQQLRRNFDLGVSQADHPEVFENISSEREGKRMVAVAFKHLVKIEKPLKIIPFVFQSGAKYIGFFLGKRYKKLSMKTVNYLTATPNYWQKKSM